MAASGITQTSITLAWTKSPGATGYDVRAGASGSWTRLGDVARYVFTGLSADTNYTLQVRAVGKIGNSAAASATARTLPNPPAAPTGLSASGITKTAMTLNWTKSPGAASYEVRPRNSGSWTSIGDVATYTFTDLSAGTKYTMQVRALNTGGSSAAASLAATTLPNPPAAPTGLTVSSATQTQLTLSWTKSTGATAYSIQIDSGTATAIGNVASTIVTGLSAGTEYTLKVFASNAGGSSAAASLTAITLPAVPTGLSSSGITQTSITLNWTKSSGASSYDVRGGTLTAWTNAGDVATYTFSGLTANTQYSLEVRAKNSAGSTDGASVASRTLAAQGLASPSSVSASGITTTSITLNWTKVSAATTYEVNGGALTGWTDAGDVSAYTFSGLTADTSYNLQVRAKNATLTSPAVTIVESTLPTTVNPPSNVRTTNITDSEIVLIWSDPIVSQSFTIQSAYTYQVRGGMIKVWTDVGNVLKFMFEGLDPATEYNLRVRRVNRGVWSPTVITSAWTLSSSLPSTSASPSGSRSDSATIDGATRSGPVLNCNDEQKALIYVSPRPHDLHVQCVGPAGVAKQDLIDRGVVIGIDVWGWVRGITQVCFKQTGDLVFNDSALVPHQPVDVIGYYNDSGWLCYDVDRAGAVILLRTKSTQHSRAVNAAAPENAPSATLAPVSTPAPSADATSDCKATLTATLNFRDSPGGGIMLTLPELVTLSVYDKQGDWIQVDFYGIRGWVASAYTRQVGNCD